MANESGWVFVQLDETMAKRHGMPANVPVPKQEFEAMGESGLGHERAQGWIRSFLGQAGAKWRTANPREAKAYDSYLAKMAPWKKAQAAFERHDFEAALRSLTMVVNVDPNDYSARQSLATVHAAAGRTAEALEAFEAIQEVWSGVADFHLGYANALLMAQRKDDALEQFVLALEAQPDCRPAMEGLVGLGVLVKLYEDPLDPSSLLYVRADSVLEHLTAQWQAGEHDVDYLLRQVAYHEDERRFDVMLAAAEQAQQVAGADHEPSLLARARALRGLGRIDAARELLEPLEANASVCVELARGALASNDTDTATQQIDRALELDPGHLVALTIKYLPSDESKLDELGRRLPQLESFTEAHPVVGSFRILARAYSRAGMEDKSLESFVRATELAPDDEELRAEYWSELGKQGKFATVLEDAEKLGEMNQRDWRLRWTEAEALNGTGKRAEARAAFTAINADESLHVAVRARAKRAVEAFGGAS